MAAGVVETAALFDRHVHTKKFILSHKKGRKSFTGEDTFLLNASEIRGIVSASLYPRYPEDLFDGRNALKDLSRSVMK